MLVHVPMHIHFFRQLFPFQSLQTCCIQKRLRQPGLLPVTLVSPQKHKCKFILSGKTPHEITRSYKLRIFAFKIIQKPVSLIGLLGLQMPHSHMQLCHTLHGFYALPLLQNITFKSIQILFCNVILSLIIAAV